MNAVIKASKLAVGYGSRTVVEGINLEALKGQLICLLGPNGSGKSTILRCLAGLLAPLKGAVYLKGRLLSALESKDLAQTLAVVLTERPSPGLVTVFELAAMGRYPYTSFLGRLSGEDREKTWEALHFVNAHDLAERCFGELSDGEKQKVLLARALVQDPEVIVLDEPTTHLDVKHRLEVMAILRQLTREKGITVLLSLHEIDLALKYCEMALLVKEGKILAWGPPEEVLSDEMVASLYDMESARFSHCLGGIELKSGGGTGVFVLAGAGSGASLYRLLNKHGFSVATGVIHENDIDCHVARAMGASVVGEKPFEEISASSLEWAVFFGRQAASVIDAGYPVGSLNRRNVELTRELLAQGKVIYCLRSREEAKVLYGAEAARLVFCSSPVALVEMLNRREANE
ncbi:MAG: ABC transporter ATP-binding protein [Firmicutes bacterium]|nr:ABC transporter ATP-binding protein [Bacillota bacterium]